MKACSENLQFQVLQQRGAARRGVLRLSRGPRQVTLETPVFMPVGTLASLKGLDSRDAAALGANIMLSNAYHLMLRPGHAVVAALGGLHRMMDYDGAILTDSGGFQIFSLAAGCNVNDSGVTFRSHLDGAAVQLTPEKLVQVQEALAPDIAMVLDQCPPGDAPPEVILRAMQRTTLWAKRCWLARQRQDIAWFGIVQGGLSTAWRAAHAQQLQQMPFAGFAIGGVSVGEAPEDIARIVHFTAPLLPADKPRYLMGVGTPADLVRGVAAGIDMFDCVMPSRNARNGYLFTSHGPLSIKQAQHKTSTQPLDSNCLCYACQHLSRGYLRHLFRARELSYYRLATLHNLTFYLQLMARIRHSLETNCFNPQAMLASLAPP